MPPPFETLQVHHPTLMPSSLELSKEFFCTFHQILTIFYIFYYAYLSIHLSAPRQVAP